MKTRLIQVLILSLIALTGSAEAQRFNLNPNVVAPGTPADGTVSFEISEPGVPGGGADRGETSEVIVIKTGEMKDGFPVSPNLWPGYVILKDAGQHEDNDPNGWSDVVQFKHTGDPHFAGGFKSTIQMFSEVLSQDPFARFSSRLDIRDVKNQIDDHKAVVLPEMGFEDVFERLFYTADGKDVNPKNDQFKGVGTYTIISDTPEPSTLAIFGLGTLGMLGYAWRRHMTACYVRHTPPSH